MLPYMYLTPTERDRLLLFSVAELARSRRARGCLLNAPEATAIVADAVVEAARDGLRHADAVAVGQRVLTRAELLPGVPEIVGPVSVEATFDDGTRLVVVPEPFGPAEQQVEPDGLDAVAAGRLPPGTVLPGSDSEGESRRAARERPGLVSVEVTNTGRVPISVTSHFHFFEVNPRLRFDRAAAYGRRLALPGGATARFGPGERRTVELVDIAGGRVAIGFSGYVDGPLDDEEVREAAFRRAREAGLMEEAR